ncbi:MAG: deoxyribodipyrimidine photo-lyase, partial [Bacteroidia bacterium]
MKINIFWFRRDLRLDDNPALSHALSEGIPVLTIFIFDTNIIDELPADDARISFIYDNLSAINNELLKHGTSLLIQRGDPSVIWRNLIKTYDIKSVFINKDYEPYPITRDQKIETLLREKGIPLFRFKDHVIIEEREILKSDNTPYTLFTPYKNKWLKIFSKTRPLNIFSEKSASWNYFNSLFPLPSLSELGFRKSPIRVRA